MPRPRLSFPCERYGPHAHLLPPPQPHPKINFRRAPVLAFLNVSLWGSTTGSGCKMNGDMSSPPPAKRQRASRKGQPRRFKCSYEGCEKRYSRAEHLARHKLNHEPKEVYHCDVEGCEHSFVRPDLFARHKKKHEESALNEQTGVQSVSPSNDRMNGSAFNSKAGGETVATGPVSPVFNFDAVATPSTPLVAQSIEPRWRPGSSYVPGIPTPTSIRPTDSITSVPNVQDQLNASTMDQFDAITNNDQSNENFAAWLFDSPGSHNSGFDFNNMPFFDFGMDFAPLDIWNFDEPSINLAQNVGARTYSSASIASDYRPDRESHLYISDERRMEIIRLLSSFMGKKPPRSEVLTQPDSILYAVQLEWPNLTVAVLENCIAAFWKDVSTQMPIAHQPTFAASRCQLYLLMSIISLGAAAIVRSAPKGIRRDYRVLGDFIATNLRWEIFTHSHSEPPVHLWVAQTLIFLEFYEKMFSTRQLHERANIYHASTLTLLRRGSPMVGRTGSETPPSELPTRATTPVPGSAPPVHTAQGEAHAWWKRWVSNECMNRVVFAAFQMDTLHACMFGHTADLLPHELRLPLPCDDSLWTAKSGQEVRRLESTFAMYGIKPINFLDGLKRCLHGYEVQTHRLGREILMAGLLSVGWHINRREKNLQFVEVVASPQEQARWRNLILQAFGHWRHNFGEVLDHHNYHGGPNGHEFTHKTSDPTALFHFAHLTMHVDIIDCQILTGTRRLLGRRVSDKDRSAVAQRMKVWAKSSSSRHATLHAFKLLKTTLCNEDGRRSDSLHSAGQLSYSCRNDAYIYRPWLLYLAGLTIWAHQYATAKSSSAVPYSQNATDYGAWYQSASHYISACAAMDSAEHIPQLISKEYCIAVLQVLSQDFANAESEILIEAGKRLQEGIKMLLETG